MEAILRGKRLSFQNLVEALNGQKVFFIDIFDNRGGVDKVTSRFVYDPVDDVLGRPRPRGKLHDIPVPLGVTYSRKLTLQICGNTVLSFEIVVKR